MASEESEYSCVKRTRPDRQAPLGRVVYTTLSAQLEKLLDSSTVTKTITTLWVTCAFTFAYYVLHKWVWRQILWVSFGSLGSLAINFIRSSRSNLSIGLLSHLLNIELFVILITKVPIAVMMPYVVQVSQHVLAFASSSLLASGLCYSYAEERNVCREVFTACT